MTDRSCIRTCLTGYRSNWHRGPTAAVLAACALTAAVFIAVPASALSPRSQAFNDWVEDADDFFDNNPTLKDSSGTGWNPYNRVKFFNQQRMVGGELPAVGAYWDAVEDKIAARAGSLGPPWRIIGSSPTNVEDDDICGRMLDIAFAPGALYAAAAGGGVWKSTDSGLSWNALTDDIPALPIGGIAVSDDDSDIIVAGTGEGKWVHEFFYSGVGIIRSTDAGSSWSPTLLDAGAWPDQSEMSGFHFVEAGPGDTLLAGSNDGLFWSVDNGANWERPERLTSPAEDPWGEGLNFYDAKWQPGDTGVVFATVGNGSDSENGVWKSTDSGESWSFAGTGQPASDVGKTELAVSPDDDDRVYALYSARGLGLTGSGGGTAGPRVYVSTDLGTSWASTGAAPDVGPQGGYNLGIVADPTDADLVLAAGRSMRSSANGGASWSTTTPISGLYADWHGLRYAPGTTSTIWALGDRGVLRSTDDGQTWETRSSGLETMQFYDIGITSGSGEYWVVGGTQDNGAQEWHGDSDVWDQIVGTDGKVCTIAENGLDAIASWNLNRSYRTRDGGEPWFLDALDGARGSFLHQIQYDPNDPTIVYAEKGPDIAAWPDSGTGTPTELGLDEELTWFSLAPNGTDFWVVSEVEPDGTSVRFSSDSGSTWNEADPFPLSWRVDIGGGQTEFLTPTRILAHPTQAGAALVVFSSYYDAPHVVWTSDWGDSWVDATGGLPPQPVNDIAVNPSNPDHWYIATDVGVYRSTNPSSPSWSEYGEGLPNVYAFDLEVNDNLQRLAVATHGRSVWEVSIFDAGAQVVWEADEEIYLDADLLVPAGATLTVEPGAVVRASAGADRHNVGDDPNRVELIVEGQLLAVGSVSDPITFTSYGGGAAGDWHGIRFVDADDDRASDIEYCDFEYATHAVTPDSIGGNIISCSFTDNTRDIYLDRDVEILAGHSWQLDAPTRVVAETSSATDLPGGESGLVDLIVSGDLITQRPPSGAGSVVFTSTEENQALGDDWGGITVVGSCTIEDADIGYAVHPVFLSMATGSSVSDTHVHHYREQGIHDWGSGATIQGCTVDEGDGFLSQFASSGILVQSSNATVADNTIGFHENYGIRVEYSEAYCASAGSGGSPDTLFVLGNVLTGSDSEPEDDTGAPVTAISLVWLCRDNAAWVQGDSISHWETGISVQHSAGVWIEGEVIQDNYTGVHYERGDELLSSEGSVRLEKNCIDSNFRYGIQIPSGVGLTMGGGTTYAPVGDNSLRLDPVADPTYFLQVDEVDDPNRTDLLECGQNTWLDRSGSVLSDSSDVLDDVDLVGTDGITFTSGLNGVENVCSSSAALARLGQALFSPAPEGPAPSADDELVDPAPPSEWRLAVAGGHPARGSVALQYDVPVGASGRATIAVHDVTGRRLATLVDGDVAVGRHTASWAPPVASGVYFVRLEARGFSSTLKVTVLR